MRRLILFSGLLAGLIMMETVRAESPKSTPAVLVQLFTSEGCSSCPPADALLAEYADKPEDGPVRVIPMSLHVDYWNNLGWTDPFSSKQFTQYQTAYQQAMRAPSIYTPQVVVDGVVDVVGSDRDGVAKAIVQASHDLKASIALQIKQLTKEAASIEIAVDRPYVLPRDERCELILAVAEDHLSNDVRRGENAGRKLQHSSVVRRMESLGQYSIDAAKTYRKSVMLDSAWNGQNLHLIAFIQSQRTLRVYGAGTIRLAEGGTSE